MALRVYSVFKTQIAIDGELIPLQIKRLLPEQSVQFVRDFNRLGRGARHSVATKDETPEETEARILKAESTEVESNAFAVQAITDYVTADPGHILDGDSEASITSGADLVRFFAARGEVLSELLLRIYLENTLTADKKAQNKRSLAPFVPTPATVADRMVSLARVTADDVLVDLGCGAGAICIAAARLGARAVGYDLDQERVREAVAAAEASGVSDRCEFLRQDITDAQIEALRPTVVSLYLLPGSNLRLKPRLQALPAGTRVISHAFTFGDWTPIASEVVPLGEGEAMAHVGQRELYLYEVGK